MKKTATSLMLCLLSLQAYATDDGVAQYQNGKKNPFAFEGKSVLSPIAATLSPQEIYEKTQAIWNHFSLAPEISNENMAAKFDGKQSFTELNRILSILDGKKQFARFSESNETSLKFSYDRDSKEYLDTDIMLGAQATYVSPAIERLRSAKNINSSKLPLQGLKIALDPGHMSTKEWDLKTGKYVRDSKGNIISEGFIALQTCLILKAEFEKLGATVFVTRENHNPITTLSLENLNVEEYGKKALKNKSYNAWFLNLLASAPTGDELFKNFENSADLKKLFAPGARDNYFILGADLQARVDNIEKFDPDISMIIHFDTAEPPNDPNGVNIKKYSRVKTYVHGSIDAEEWASASERGFALNHVLDTASYDSSKLLAVEVVNGLKNGLKLDYDVTGAGSSNQVVPGVFARNLFITKKLHGHAHTYVECLHYNDPNEFKALMKKDFSMVVAGETTYYSKRLRDVAYSIRNGVLNFMTKI